MLKRGMDLVLGAALAAASAIIVVAMALVLAVELRAWPFFVQRRVGRHGRTFRLVKMRTLPPDTPTSVDKYALEGVEVPPIARWLRAAHLDELPQLWLVVSGHMSLVGPRPEMPGLAADLPGEFARTRQRVRPGCTGLWQVSVAAERLIHEHPEYDRAYVEHHSLRLDLWILWQTLLVMMGRPRTVTLGATPLSVEQEDVSVIEGDLRVMEQQPELAATRDGRAVRKEGQRLADLPHVSFERRVSQAHAWSSRPSASRTSSTTGR